MFPPRLDKLLEHVDSNYASVLVAAKRARQINSYYHNLGEGTFEEFPPPMIDTASKNYLTIALEEVARSEEHTSELQSRQYLVCRLLLEKKNKDAANVSSGVHPHAHGIAVP